jgi:hypothetical protein
MVPRNMAGRAGRREMTAVGGERVRAYIPPPLPPDPPIDLGPFQTQPRVAADSSTIATWIS